MKNPITDAKNLAGRATIAQRLSVDNRFTLGQRETADGRRTVVPVRKDHGRSSVGHRVTFNAEVHYDQEPRELDPVIDEDESAGSSSYRGFHESSMEDSRDQISSQEKNLISSNSSARHSEKVSERSARSSASSRYDKQ